MVDFVKTICASVKSCVFLAFVIQPLIGNPYNGYINSYYWVDDHPLLYGNNGSLDPIAHLRGAQLVLPSAFQCDRSRIPQRSGQMWHEKKTAASAYLFHLQSAWMVVVFLLIWNLTDDFETKPNHFGDTNSFHPELVWPFWRQVWLGSWVHDFIWRWVCNQVEDLNKHAKGSQKMLS